MNKFKIFAVMALTMTLLLTTSVVASAGGPVEQTPPDSIDLNSYVSNLVTTNADRVQSQIPQQAEGPAPCLNVASHVPDIVIGQQYK